MVATTAVIVGGGVIGLSIAWRAAQRGFAVTVVDPQVGAGASHAAAGMLTPVAEATYAEEPLLRLGLESLKRYPEFVAELEAPTGFRTEGTLQVAYDADDLAVIAETETLQAKFGVAAQRLSARECRELEPDLAPAVSGGLFTADDGSVDPRLLVNALRTAATRAGVAFLAESAVTVGPHRVVMKQSTLTADWVVVAAGHASGALAGLPVRPVKGQILRLRGEPLLARCVRGVVRGARIYLVQRADGELVVGATQEEMGTDIRVTAGGVWELLRDARALLPGITELELAETTARLRPGTPDNAPILGPASDGVLVATGHFRGGVLLAPITADLMTDFMQTERRTADLLPFGPERFACGS